ncbi:MAG: formate dehydrogenase subunit gamma [Rhodospirillales bacterium]|nr:formate dehydrogenase subunit gamma [Rhodospirillales bacterium]
MRTPRQPQVRPLGISIRAVFLLLIFLFALPAAAADALPGGALGKDSDADVWRQVRQGQAFNLSGTTSGTPVLVQSEGAAWRALRNGPISTYGGWLLVLAGAGVALFFLVRGRVRLAERSGRTVPRFTHAERAAHWFVAATFVLLALSGLVILFGKYILQPVVGVGAFAVIASAALQGHNLFGPLFAAGIVVMFVLYLKDNLPRGADFLWLLKGGLFFRGHVSSWKFNFGEKTWFWISSLGGFALAASGLLMDFPWLAQTVQQLQLAHIVHAIAAVVVIAASFGHMYLGTVGVEGALEGMTTGRVDETWALDHHDLWAKEILEAETKKAAGAVPESAPAE